MGIGPRRKRTLNHILLTGIQIENAVKAENAMNKSKLLQVAEDGFFYLKELHIFKLLILQYKQLYAVMLMFC